MSPIRWATEFARDVRYALRTLANSRSFTAIAVGSLALGIGGSTAMYSVVHAVVLDPFPYREPDRLLSVAAQGDRGGNGSYYSIDRFLDIAERNRVFDGVVASTWSDVTWTGDGEPRRLRGNHCTMNTFEVMGVPPLIGRVTTASDAAAGAAPVTVLGYRFWHREFGGEPKVLGRRLRLNDTVRTVIGVMPPRFMWRGADVYLPDVLRRGQTLDGVTDVHLMGRLKRGVTHAQAEADLRPILEDLQKQEPDRFPRAWKLRLRDFGETFPSAIRSALWILFGAVGLLLVIACLNVSNLLLSRAAYRRREIAIRASMGAGRARLVRQLLTESLALAAGGGLLGIAVAWAMLRGIIAMVPPNTIPDEAEISLNLPVLLFTLGVSAAAALFFGLAPALQLSGRDLLTPLREAGRGASGPRGQKVFRGALVIGEVALSLMLLVGASLMIRTLASIQGANFGFHPDRILSLRIPFSEQRYPDPERRNAFLLEALRRIAALPGVSAASINTGLPPVYGWTTAVTIPGAPAADSQPVMLHNANEAYARVMGLTQLEGRFLTEQEVNAHAHGAVVNHTFVRRYFPDGRAIGRVVRVPRLRLPPVNAADDSFEIVGVVGDTVNRAGTNETLPEMYLPFTILGMADRVLVLAAAGIPAALQQAVKAQIYGVDPGQPVMEVETMETVLAENAYSRPRFNLVLFSAFAGLGLALALFGIYGVISHAVAQQTREIGIRMALGATVGEVVGGVLQVGVRLLAIGIGVGLAASLASVKLLAGLVRASTFDAWSFAGVAVLVFAAGVFASFWPARRAARVDPVTALREQ